MLNNYNKTIKVSYSMALCFFSGLLCHTRIKKSKKKKTLKGLPFDWINGNGVRLSSYISYQTSAVGSLELAHINRVSQLGPVGCVIAEPVHSRVVRPVDISSNPISCHISGPPKVWALQKAGR